MRIGGAVCPGLSDAVRVHITIGGAALQLQPKAFTCWTMTPGGRLSTTVIGALVGNPPMLATVMT